MINHVRKTVLTVLNKENRGFLTPDQFNSYAKHAQLLLFEQYFSEYARLNTLKNAKRLSKDYGDRLSVIRAAMNRFNKVSTISQTSGYYVKPTDMYHHLNISYSGKEVEYVSPSRETYLTLSSMSGPSETYPGYCDENDYFYLKPSTLTGDIKLIYLRTPKDPKWTYNMSLTGEDPLFNPSASDYQDFELGPQEQTNLIIEILKLAGVTIREPQITQVAAQADAVETQKENV